MLIRFLYILVLLIGITMLVTFGGGGVSSPPVLSGAAFFLLALAGLIKG